MLLGGLGSDTLNGDEGDDTLFTGADNVTNTANGGDGNDFIFAGSDDQ